MTCREQCWRFTAPSGRILSCRIYENDVDVEVRVSFDDDDALDSRLVFEIGTARAIANQLRATVLANFRFAELPNASHTEAPGRLDALQRGGCLSMG